MIKTAVGAVRVQKRGTGPTVVLWHSLFVDTTQTRARVSRFLVRKGLDIRLKRSERCVQVGPVLLESHDNRVQHGS